VWDLSDGAFIDFIDLGLIPPASAAADLPAREPMFGRGTWTDPLFTEANEPLTAPGWLSFHPERSNTITTGPQLRVFALPNVDLAAAWQVYHSEIRIVDPFLLSVWLMLFTICLSHLHLTVLRAGRQHTAVPKQRACSRACPCTGG